MDLMTTVWTFIQLCCLMYSTNAQTAERDIDICDKQNDFRARLIHLANPDFPSTPSTNKHCTCKISSSNGLLLTVSLRFYISASVSSLTLKYENEGENITWAGFSSNFTSRDQKGDMLLITDSTTVVEVVYKQIWPTRSIFALDVGALNISDELRFTCKQLQDIPTEKTTSSPDVNFVDKFCNSHTLIILVSVCVAFLLIIIVLSIMLCCTVRKSKTIQMRHTSGTSQPLSTQSSLGLPMESYRIGSSIYDDGMAARVSTNGDQYPVPRHHSLPGIRQSAAYMNALEMNLYGNT